MRDFIKSSVAYGMKQNELDDLPKGVKKKLIRLMARISEASYRRGFQQGVVFKEERPKTITNDLWKWRFEQSLDKAKGGDGFNGVLKSQERLFLEYGELREIGLWDIE